MPLLPNREYAKLHIHYAVTQSNIVPSRSSAVNVLHFLARKSRSRGKLTGRAVTKLLSLTVGEASDLDDAAIVVQRVEARIRIGLQVTAVAFEETDRMFRFARLRELKDHCRRMFDPITIVIAPRAGAEISPQPCCFRAATPFFQ